MSQRKKEKNIFTEIDKRNGRVHTVVSLQWPDGERFRRRCLNLALARDLLARVNGAVVTDKWKELRKELSGDQDQDYTIKEFADTYLEEHCNVRNRRPGFKVEKLKHIKEIIGHVKLREFSSADAAYFEKERAKALDARTGKPISKATVNRGLAVLSHMMTFALKKKLIAPPHPMARYGRLPEVEKALRVMTLEEERRLVQKVMNVNAIVGVYVGLLGETGLRKSEGLNLKWDYVDVKRRVLTVAASKSGRTRRVPLSDYALELLGKLPRVEGCPFVFVWPDTKQPLRDPRYWFFEGREKAGLEWVGFHDFRHFRATQWIMRGVDIRTVQGLLGHSTIQTTERYVKFVDTHASKVVIEAQRQEQLEWAAQNWQQTGNEEGLELGVSVN